VLKVEHIIVCGHYGCSGVSAALNGERVGLADNWLRHVQDVHAKHEPRVAATPRGAQRVDRLCELNVIEQVANVCQTTIMRDAWERGQEVTVHGWVYGLRDGLVRDLNTSASSPAEAAAAYQAALAAL
jgi:carbonic anhydrase